MKAMNPIKAIALSLALLIPTASFASHKVEECVGQSNLVVALAVMRDLGEHPAAVFNTLIQKGVSQEHALAVIEFIFNVMADVPHFDIGTMVFKTCIGEDA